MVNFICFGSGSSGNCYYLNADGYGMLIDLGIGLRKFRKYMSDYGLSMAQIKAILATHDHADHVKSVGAFAQTFHLPVYTQAGTYVGMDRNRFMHKKVPGELRHVITDGEPFVLGPFTITPFAVPHDSVANCGYSIEVQDIRFCLMTDVGQVTDTVRQQLRDADYVVVEANYDAQMLEHGPYPRYLKDRIRSGTGHLDNADTARLLAEELTPRTRHVWLCHLSEENNHPTLAHRCVSDALIAAGRLTDNDALVVETLKRCHPSCLYTLAE